MGLDMYLSAEKYVKGWQFRRADGTLDEDMKDKMFDPIMAVLGNPPVASDSRSLTVELTVAYWRKVNQVHKWFVDHAQDGEDHCQKSYVEREQLVELRDLVRGLHKEWALAETPEEYEKVFERCEEYLPLQEGFFFGGTDLGDDYFYDLMDTDIQLTTILENPVLNADEGLEAWTYYYTSSW